MPQSTRRTGDQLPTVTRRVQTRICLDCRTSAAERRSRSRSGTNHTAPDMCCASSARSSTARALPRSAVRNAHIVKFERQVQCLCITFCQLGWCLPGQRWDVRSHAGSRGVPIGHVFEGALQAAVPEQSQGDQSGLSTGRQRAGSGAEPRSGLKGNT